GWAAPPQRFLTLSRWAPRVTFWRATLSKLALWFGDPKRFLERRAEHVGQGGFLLPRLGVGRFPGNDPRGTLPPNQTLLRPGVSGPLTQREPNLHGGSGDESSRLSPVSSLLRERMRLVGLGRGGRLPGEAVRHGLSGDPSMWPVTSLPPIRALLLRVDS